MDPQKDLQQKINAHYREKGKSFDQMFDKLTFEYKLLKKMIHECQMNCFSTESFSRHQAEQCSRKCMEPYLSIRKYTGDQIQGCDKSFQAYEPKCIQGINDIDICYQGLINSLSLCLNNQIPKIKDAYKTVFSDFATMSKVEYSFKDQDDPLIKNS